MYMTSPSDDEGSPLRPQAPGSDRRQTLRRSAEAERSPVERCLTQSAASRHEPYDTSPPSTIYPADNFVRTAGDDLPRLLRCFGVARCLAGRALQRREA